MAIEVLSAVAEQSLKDHDNEVQSVSSGTSESHIKSHSDPSTSEYDSTTGTTATGSNAGDDENDLRRKIIKEEETNVRRARTLVGVAFLFCATAVTASVFFFTKQNDQATFESQFEGYAEDIIPLVVWEVRYNFALLEQLSASITIASHQAVDIFPNHTDPDFEITGGFADGMGGIISAGFAPLIDSEERGQWEEYSVLHQDWIERSKYLEKVHPNHRDALHGTIQDHEHDRRLQGMNSISSEIFRWEDGVRVPEGQTADTLFAPLWQVSPADYSVVNANLLSDPVMKDTYEMMRKADRAVMSANTEILDVFDFLFDADEKDQKKAPYSFVFVPVHDDFVAENAKTVGMVVGVTLVGNLLDRLLPAGEDGIVGVVKDSCGGVVSYELNSGKAHFLGWSDVHETQFDEYERVQTNIEMYDEALSGLVCERDLYIYPSSKFRARFDTNTAYMYSAVVAIAFTITGVLIVVYDCMVNRRQMKVMKAAARTEAIVTSLFPKKIGKKLVEEVYGSSKPGNGSKETMWKKQGGPALQTILGHTGQISGDNNVTSHMPLADLFPSSSVFFGDLTGFTAWASMREPSQVFMLLEGLYAAFDKIAARKKVFKVETVGDCYVAVCGLPEERPDHAVVLCRFARDCLSVMYTTLNQLTVDLGPDTMELGMRIGIHSGPVTAGVLRGERARFQLFGDTVNTAARLESTGAKNRIQCSQETRDLLVAAGKQRWITPRESKINAKGKGVMQTYWVYTTGDAAPSSSAGTGNDDDLGSSLVQTSRVSKVSLSAVAAMLPKQDQRIIDWNFELLSNLLKDIAARRRSTRVDAEPREVIHAMERDILSSVKTPFEELKPFFRLPKYTPNKEEVDPSTIVLGPDVVTQLRDFIVAIAAMYHENAFHNFAHASHVTLSVVKLMKRIVVPTENDTDNQNLHDHTFGITSDPLTQFSVILSALVHDIDHKGVTNAQLIKEKDALAVAYKEKSIAEQNSVDMAWALLMEDRFEDLRAAIYTTTAELHRFRQMLVHTVLATDIMDKELSQDRKNRWNVTFVASGSSEVDETLVDRKATIVIEHLMQASDVAHTMQHWYVYRKWNARLFKECYQAYLDGRAASDPSENWYQGELGFFDFYVIPLAQKLKACGVFGVSGDEYLNYAKLNRDEMAEKGPEMVEEWVSEMKKLKQRTA